MNRSAPTVQAGFGDSRVSRDCAFAAYRFGYRTALQSSGVFTLDQTFDAATAEDDGNYRIMGLDGKVISIKAADDDPATFTVALHPKQRISVHHTCKRTIDGTAPHELTNAAWLLLDGTGAGRADSDDRTALSCRNLVLDPPWRRVVAPVNFSKA